MVRESILVHKDTRQIVIDIIREHPTATLRYDDTTYAAPVYHLISDDSVEGKMYLRQDFVATVHQLTDGARDVPVAQLRDIAQYLNVK